MIFLLLSILFFGFNNVLWKKNLEQVDFLFLVSYRALFTSILSIIIALSVTSFDTVTISILFRVTLGSIFGVIGLLCMLSVIQKASLHWLGIYNLMGIGVTTCYLIVYENFAIKQSILGASILLLGFMYHIYTNSNKSLTMSLKQHVLMVVMTVSFCVSSILHWKNLAKEIPALVIVSNQEFVVFITTTLIFLLKNKKTISFEPYKKHFLNVILMAGVIFLALLFSFLGLKLTNPLISSLVFLASPLTTIVMNLVFFKEKLSVHNSIALVLLGAGAFILHYNTN
jgi:drug/metabolite transporter (DMT)-like permease